jgi:hypothetical protein
VQSSPYGFSQSVDPMDVENDIIFGAQIWYRNIVDRFPTIPRYLARRLAEANLRRAERLNDMASARGRSSVRAQTLLDVDLARPIDITRTTAYMPQLSSDYHTGKKPMDSFWTGGRARRRSASVHSAYSSMNSSLRGDEACFDPGQDRRVDLKAVIAELVT